MNVCRYPAKSLNHDYMRSGVGFLLTFLPTAIYRPPWPLALMLGTVAVVCAFLIVRTMDKQRTTVLWDDEGVTKRSFSGASFGWDDLTALSLIYYSPKAGASHGWMEVTLKAGPRVIKVDSSLDYFVDMVRRAYQASKSNGVRINDLTVANLRALRIDD